LPLRQSAVGVNHIGEAGRCELYGGLEIFTFKGSEMPSFGCFPGSKQILHQDCLLPYPHAYVMGRIARRDMLL